MNGKRQKGARVAGLVGATLIGLYVVSFAVEFEMFGCPSRTRTHWFGPTPRANDDAIDVGKVYEWGGEKETGIPKVFTVYCPLCKVWLMVNGLKDW